MKPLFEATDPLTDKSLFVDCRHSLQDTDYGKKQFLLSHIPGSFFAHLDKNLSDPKKIKEKIFGRHPLPEKNDFLNFLKSNGVNNNSHLIAYDDSDGVYASRFWWMLQMIGHNNVSILNGGIDSWKRSGKLLDKKIGSVKKGNISFKGSRVFEWRLPEVKAWVSAKHKDEIAIVIDARATERFKGLSEPIDKKAGHIPGAINRPFTENLGSDGKFKSALDLEKEYKKLIGNSNPANIVHMCGSGVTACHNLFSMELCELTGSSLYVGSWSEWCQHN